ncbi:XRE family transcriptional regulator [Enterococcus avium]|uniref:LexA family protein n=1 Tax=Enterococcus TaxID=1350 RepID=UPI0020733557|nr:MULTISPECIES: XRE family transcriptional regulator [Enterococcus]MDT2471898.1 XRE family transcriptional regulator [Enterococcus avium]
MDTLGKRIRILRERKNWTQTELSQELGMKTYTTVSKWESDENFPKGKDLKKLAELFGVSSDYLLGLSTVSKQDDISTIYNQLVPPRQEKVYNFAERQLEEQNRKVVPLFGTTAANPTELSYGDINMEDTIEINVPKKAECALVVKGDSMEPEYQNGDIVFYKSQPAVENGEMAIVEIDGDGVTLKKVYYNYDDDKVVLRSLNGKYEDRELEPERVRILGKVVK